MFLFRAHQILTRRIGSKLLYNLIQVIALINEAQLCDKDEKVACLQQVGHHLINHALVMNIQLAGLSLILPLHIKLQHKMCVDVSLELHLDCSLFYDV